MKIPFANRITPIPRRWGRMISVCLLAAAVLSLVGRPVRAQAKKKVGAIVDKTLTAKDGHPIAITY